MTQILIRFDGPAETLQLTPERLLRRGEITTVSPRTADKLDSYERVRITRIAEPAMTGAGSGRREWAEYAAGLGVPATPEMSRDQIVRAVSNQQTALTGRPLDTPKRREGTK